MTKKEFLKKLSGSLRNLEKQERKRYISDYEELISDMVDSGMTEAEAVAKQGEIENIASEILNNVEPGRRIKRDVPGIALYTISILLFVISIVCLILFPGIAAVGVVDGSGASAVFFAGKMSEPYGFYIAAAIFFVADLAYSSVRKRKGCLITAIVLLALFACVFLLRKPIRSVVYGQGTETEQQKEVSVEDRTLEILDLFHAGEYEKLSAEYTADEMLPYMTESYMDEAKNMIGDDWGAFVSYGKVYTSEVTQNNIKYTVAQVSASFEKVSVTYTITYDAEDLIAGFYMK